MAQSKITTASLQYLNNKTFRIIHPFHPSLNKEFELRSIKTPHGERRVYYYNSEGCIASVPLEWTDIEKHIEGLSISKLQDYVANFGEDEILSITSDQLSDFKQLIHDAINKIMTTEHYLKIREKISLMGSEQERLIAFIEFAQGFECFKIDPQIRGPCGLPYDFYLNEGGYCGNAPFLFGTPSQFRKI